MGKIKIDDVCNLVRLAHVVTKKTNHHVSVDFNSNYGVAVMVNTNCGEEFLEFFSVDPMECSEEDCKTYVKCRNYLKELISGVSKSA